MPTEFTKCSECQDLTFFEGLLNNQTYEEHKDIFNLLLKLNLPGEICIKIMKYNIKLYTCSECYNLLCKKHFTRAQYWFSKYRDDKNNKHKNGALCYDCTFPYDN